MMQESEIITIITITTLIITTIIITMAVIKLMKLFEFIVSVNIMMQQLKKLH